MPPAPVRAHVPEPRNVQPQLAPPLVLDLQARQLGVDVEDRLRGDAAQPRGRVDVQPREQMGRGLRAHAVEC